MILIKNDEIDKLDELLLQLSNIREPVDGRDSFGLYYEGCSYQHKRLKKLLDEFDIVFSDIYDLFESWYDRKKGENIDGLVNYLYDMFGVDDSDVNTIIVDLLSEMSRQLKESKDIKLED